MKKKSAPKRQRGRPRTFDREGVLAVAIDAYLKGDPAYVSVNSVCKQAGVSKPSLYRELGGEDGLTRAALEEYAETVLTSVLDIVSSQSKFKTILSELTSFAAHDPRFESGCLYVKMRASKFRFGPQTQEKIEELERASREAFVALLERSITRGEWSGTQPGIAGRYLNEQIGLALTQRASGQNPEHIERMLVMALAIFE
ncbi:MAG: TetR/AcrR family transcriptional regulator [Pseudomonadota bacterium]